MKHEERLDNETLAAATARIQPMLAAQSPVLRIQEAPVPQATITIRPDAQTVSWIEAEARRQRRTVANMATVLIEEAVGRQVEHQVEQMLPFVERITGVIEKYLPESKS